jgi:hypothetical protein
VQLEHVVADAEVAVGLARQRLGLALESVPSGRAPRFARGLHARIIADPARG